MTWRFITVVRLMLNIMSSSFLGICCVFPSPWVLGPCTAVSAVPLDMDCCSLPLDCWALSWPQARWPQSVSQFSHSVVSDSLRPHESQHARPPCPSQTPGVYSNSCPSSQWRHPAVSSSVAPFSSCPQPLPASGSFTSLSLFLYLFLFLYLLSLC